MKSPIYNLHKLLFSFFLALSMLSLGACGERAAPQNKKTVSENGSNSQAHTAIDSSFTIVPGYRIGKVIIGMQPEEVQSVLGNPDLADTAMGKAKMTWYSAASDSPRHQVDVYTIRQMTGEPEEIVQVEQVRVTSPSFTIPSTRISPGTRLTQIQQYFPNLEPVAYYFTDKQKRIYIYDDQVGGVAFELTGPDSMCVAITVHPKGSGAQHEYIPVSQGLVRLRR